VIAVAPPPGAVRLLDLHGDLALLLDGQGGPTGGGIQAGAIDDMAKQEPFVRGAGAARRRKIPREGVDTRITTRSSCGIVRDQLVVRRAQPYDGPIRGSSQVLGPDVTDNSCRLLKRPKRSCTWSTAGCCYHKREMRERFQVRVVDDAAQRYLDVDDVARGRRLGPGYQYFLWSDDPLLGRLASLHAEAAKQGQLVVSYSEVRREYDDGELDDAFGIALIPRRVFQPAGEEVGTVYDDSGICVCGAGHARVSPLRLDLSNAPASSDIVMTIAREVIFSERFVESFVAASGTGATFEPVEDVSQNAPSDTGSARPRSGLA
jgi:hypothetical protein